MSFKKPGSFWFTAAAFVLLLISVGLALRFWDWLHPRDLTTVSNSETLRNVGLLIAGGIAFVFALWRGWVAERQTSVAQHQAITAQQSLLNERYQQGAEMLGSEVLAVRLGGIYALERLAAEHPEQYHVEVMRLFCAFARNPTGSDEDRDKTLTWDEGFVPKPRVREDVQTVLTAIGSRSLEGIEWEYRTRHFHLNLSGTHLKGASLRHVNLRHANLTGANLEDAELQYTDLSWANLSDARFMDAIMSDFPEDYSLTSDDSIRAATRSHVRLSGANISGAVFCLSIRSTAKGLLQSQLDEACADPYDLPDVRNVADALTGEPLVWQGKACNSEE